MSDGPKNNVVFLAHKNEATKETKTSILTCGTCDNKAWTGIYDAKGDGFPRLRCTACGTEGGVFGWVEPDKN